MVIDFFSKASHFIVLRQFSETGPYFIIRICNVTNRVMKIDRTKILPNNWTSAYVQELIRRGDEIFKKQAVYA